MLLTAMLHWYQILTKKRCHMRKVVIFILLGFVVFALLAESGVFEALALFFLAGVIPGTNLTIPSTLMFLVLIGIAWLVLCRFIITDALPEIRKLRRSDERKKRLPKRRFSQI